MMTESITGVSRTPSFRSALKVGGERSGENNEIDANQQSFLEAQRKAAEDFKRKQDEQQKQREKQQELDMLGKQLEASKKEADAMGDEFETFSKCMKIASRIAKGDIVPPKDIKYLMEHEPDLYKQAILLRVPNDKPKKHKSVLDDEDEKSESAQNGGETGGSTEVAETAEPVEAADEAEGTAEE
ncbi:MAG: hypothetical protein IK093_16250 [Ruminiclostridium sp.]|nr:hypothetical protein [Ruminiclostridium sp.]